MAVDGIVLNRLVSLMNETAPLKINRITQPSPHEFMLQCFAGKKQTLFVSTHPVFSRVQWTQNKSTQNLDQTHFLMLLRKHLDGGILEKIEQYNYDRVIEFHINHRDEMGVIRHYRLIVELLGKYANIILVNEEGIILDAQKRITSFENNQRSIVSGSLYEYPPQFNKLPITQLEQYDPEQSLREQFNGISPLLEKEISYRLKTESPASVLETLLNSDTLYVYEHDFHILELTHRNESYKTYPIMEGLDLFYHDLQEQDRIKSHTGDLMKIIRRELKRSRQKLPKLYDELDRAQHHDHLREAGELLYAFASDLSNGRDSITLKDFENRSVTLQLDPRYGGKENAKRYFKQYQKAKTSLKYLEEQILKTEERIHYFERLEEQLNLARLEDAQEIREELVTQGYLRAARKKTTSAKAKKPHYITIHYDSETTIYIGKNNIQNEYISFKLARKQDMWFHAAHTSGSHVIIQSPALDEAKIRLCAHFAAYYSKSRHSSSVEVHYTEARNLKKIPGAALGNVAIKSQKSIFIDPDEALILSYVNA